ncbi:hypothetical protein MJH12_02360 [bacterium]|nr:hypothetical protein [bacterium]
MYSYPLTNLLELPVISISRNLIRKQNSTTSMFTGEQRIYDLDIAWWEGTLSLPRMTREQAQYWESQFLKLNGLVGTFYYAFKDTKVPLGTASGTPVVGAFSNGDKTVTSSGWSANQTVLKAGDFINFSNFELKRVVDDVVSDSLGNATLNFEPAMRKTVGSGTAITCAPAKGIFRLSHKNHNVSVNLLTHYDLTISIREAF